VAIRQDEGTPSNPSDDVIIDCDFLLFGWSRDQLLFPRSDEDFPGISAPLKADLQRLIAARPALIAANQYAIDHPLPVGPPLPPGPRRYFRLKVSTLDSDGDGIFDSDEIAAGTNPYANPALNPPGSSANAANTTGLKWKPFWKRNLPQVTIQQKWRRAEIAILEDNHPTNGTHTMARVGSVQNHAMAAPRTTGLATPVPLRDQVRLNPRNEIFRSWGFVPTVSLDPAGAIPEWQPWTPEGNQPLYARYRCRQAQGGVGFFPDADWVWQLNGE
jgi:hypothetical protein